jgi:hypothetical protein
MPYRSHAASKKFKGDKSPIHTIRDMHDMHVMALQMSSCGILALLNKTAKKVQFLGKNMWQIDDQDEHVILNYKGNYQLI